MKNSPKLSFLAAVAIQALLTLIPISASATTETDQEIGVPQAVEEPVSGCFGAVLSSDGDRFYALREGLLTQYQIKPFKKIGSIEINWTQLKERKGESCRSVWVTNDKSKLIIVYSDRMFLLDVRTGQILNQYERTDLAISFAITTLNDDELVVLERYGSDEAFYMNLSVWDANTLKPKRHIRDLGKQFGFFADQVWWGISKIQNRIYLENSRYLVVLNSKTYSAELTVAKTDRDRPKISKSFDKLYLPDVSKVTDHITGKQSTYDDVRGDNVLVFDQETRHASIENIKNISRDKFDPVLVHRDQLSRNKEFVMVGTPFHLIEDLNSRMRFRFTLYESSEAILFECPIGDLCKKFQLTPNARKYLIMKNSEGKIVPINDATFEKYYRKKF